MYQKYDNQFWKQWILVFECFANDLIFLLLIIFFFVNVCNFFICICFYFCNYICSNLQHCSMGSCKSPSACLINTNRFSSIIWPLDKLLISTQNYINKYNNNSYNNNMNNQVDNYQPFSNVLIVSSPLSLLYFSFFL